ncbi:TolC family protein [Neptuniibacter sp.]|uniref:TolC family protein n=1 Tax=Neptuniibacter sp. TaxID=1962643 RepID=UPI00261EA288|nr:TolC family protein [Neptuniibacter sp.]MCP4596730.1 TolC family protein [Neptuniibacter sp.]
MRKSPLVILLTTLLNSFVFSSYVQAELTLDSAIEEALQADHWNRSNLLQEQAIRSEAMASAQLPDPKLRLALANLPLDSLDFNQENMTQLQFGLSQQFPRGDSLALKEQQINLMADKNPLQRLQRMALIKLNVSQTWIALHQSSQQLDLLKRKRHIFHELVSISRANFRSGKAKRFEVLDAELQLTRLRDRITQLEKSVAQQQGQLQKWLLSPANSALPVSLQAPDLLTEPGNLSALESALNQHPQMQLIAQDIQIKDKGVELAEEAYKPGFKVDANYGYRDDASSGMERADFLSVAVTMDLPLFPEKRQDQRRNAAIKQRESSKELRLLKARELKSGVEVALADLAGLQQRLSIYDRSYLLQLSEKRKAALRAYAAADARFNEVASSAISELEAQLQRIALEHQIARANVQVNYYLAGVDPQLTSAQSAAEDK